MAQVECRIGTEGNTGVCAWSCKFSFLGQGRAFLDTQLYFTLLYEYTPFSDPYTDRYNLTNPLSPDKHISLKLYYFYLSLQGIRCDTVFGILHHRTLKVTEEKEGQDGQRRPRRKTATFSQNQCQVSPWSLPKPVWRVEIHSSGCAHLRPPKPGGLLAYPAVCSTLGLWRWGALFCGKAQ